MPTRTVTALARRALLLSVALSACGGAQRAAEASPPTVSASTAEPAPTASASPAGPAPSAPQDPGPPGAPAPPSPGFHDCGPEPQPECVELCRALCARVATCGFDWAASCQTECEAVYLCPGESPGHDRVLCAFEPARVQAMPCRGACAMATRRASCE